MRLQNTTVLYNAMDSELVQFPAGYRKLILKTLSEFH